MNHLNFKVIIVLLLLEIKYKRIQSFHRTKVLQHEVMRENSSSVMINVHQVTTQRGEGLLI